jgi:hypothetical protein
MGFGLNIRFKKLRNLVLFLTCAAALWPAVALFVSAPKTPEAVLFNWYPDALWQRQTISAKDGQAWPNGP